jgi:hypothetical protein
VREARIGDDLTDAGGEGFRHHAPLGVVAAEEVTDLVLQDREQVHAVILALVAGRGELGVVSLRRQVDESAPACRAAKNPLAAFWSRAINRRSGSCHCHDSW